MSQTPVGSWPWALSTGGTLSQRDRRALMRQVFRFQVQRFLKRWKRRQLPLAVENWRFPESASAFRAIEVCAQLSPLWLQHHCTRTYLWGSLLAQQRGLQYDEELLFVAAMLHDLGLTEAHLGREEDAHCFSVEGARAARAFAGEEQWDERRRDALAEAICLHLNMVVGIESGTEAHLLQAGAAYDVLGIGYRSVAAGTRSLVLERYPRLGMKREFDKLLRQQVAMRPASRAAFLYHTIGFGERMVSAPFSE